MNDVDIIINLNFTREKSTGGIFLQTFGYMLHGQCELDKYMMKD